MGEELTERILVHITLLNCVCYSCHGRWYTELDELLVWLSGVQRARSSEITN